MKRLAALVIALACSGTYERVRAQETPPEPAPDVSGTTDDAPPSETPSAEAPASDAPASDALASDALASDAPASDAPASDAPASDAPASEAPAAQPAPASETPRVTPVPRAVDDEPVPMSRSARPPRPGMSRGAASQPVRLASPIPPPPDPFEGRRYPESASQRPLTLSEGVWRLDHVVDWNVMHFAVEAPNTLTAGLTNDVEIGVAWPWTRDPTLFGTVRFFGSDLVDLGVRASVRAPLVTTGDTVVRAGIPVVIRPTRHVRIQTGLDVELLLTPQISPWAWIPFQIMGNPVPSMFLGAQGSVGWLDGSRVTGQAGLFVGHTVSATPRGHPIFEVRWTTSYMFELNDLHVTCAISFFPRVW